MYYLLFFVYSGVVFFSFFISFLIQFNFQFSISFFFFFPFSLKKIKNKNIILDTRL